MSNFSLLFSEITMLKKKKSFSMSVPEYTEHRDKLLSGGWMTAVFDSEKNGSVYKPTIKGTGIYSVIVKLIGRDSLINGYKLNIKDLDKMKIEEGAQTTELIKVLLDNDILSKSYNPETDEEKYELTVNGAKLMVAFFVSNDRNVNTLPGDTKAKIIEIIGNVPRYSLKFCEIMNNIAKGFQAFDNMNQRPKEHVVSKPKWKSKWKPRPRYNNKKYKHKYRKSKWKPTQKTTKKNESWNMGF